MPVSQHHAAAVQHVSVWQHIVGFLDSSFFVALITLIVGSLAIYLYRKQKRDGKMRAARIILLEIRNAEKQLKEARTRIDEAAKTDQKILPERLYTMPTDSWAKHNHLFVKDFSSDAWEAINAFYDKCALFDEAIRHNDKRFSKDEQQIRHSVHRATYEYAKEYNSVIADPDASPEEKENATAQFIRDKNSLISILTNTDVMYFYVPMKQFSDVQACLNSVDTNLSLGAVGIKLEKISNGKRWMC